MKIIYTIVFAFFLTACSSLEITTISPLPSKNDVQSITIFSLENYTDTPQAGMRASNLLKGVLLSKNYTLVDSIPLRTKSLQEKLQVSAKNGSDYLLTGGVSEWRYKTGIDGEPAISIQCTLIHVDTAKVVWSATASSNDWGNASIGTTAQAMIESMFENK